MTSRSCACMQKGCSITRTKAFKSSVRGRPSTSRHTFIRLRQGPAAACRMTTADQVPPVQQQAAEHRQHVLAKFRQPGLIVIQVAEGKSATRFTWKASTTNFCHILLRFLLNVTLQGKTDLARNSDVMHPFRQDSNFAYLTGIHLPGFACAIHTETGHYTLLAPKLDPQLVVWMGAQPSLEELAEVYGADSCAYWEDLDKLIASKFNNMTIYTTQNIKSLQQLTDAHAGAHHLQSSDLEAAISASRAIKTDADLACLSHASEVSAEAHMAMWRYGIHTIHTVRADCSAQCTLKSY